jgi:hypothetical protein
MDSQRFAIKGRVIGADDPQLQDALAHVYETPERPRCLCVPGGVEMYVARHRQFVVKRMPDSGSAHHPGCPSYEPEVQQSGLGELVGEAVLESEPGRVELRVDFPWMRVIGRGVPRGEPQEVAEIGVPRRQMTLRALMHFLFERAGFNRWSPAMAGKRNQGVLRKYLTTAPKSVAPKPSKVIRAADLSPTIYLETEAEVETFIARLKAELLDAIKAGQRARIS